MNAITTTTVQGHIAVTNGQPTTTTQDIADVYGKQHAKVLAVVRQRMAEVPADWCLANFGEASVEVKQPNGGTVAYPVIRMTKKGFHFVVGKFTGTKAVAHQIAFADEFERMEAALRTPTKPIPDMLKVADLLTKTARALRESGVPKQLALAIALDEVHMKTGVRMLPNYTPAMAISAQANSKIVKFIKNAKRYASDRRYGELCSQGMMPQSKLLKLTGLRANEFGKVLAEAIVAKQVVVESASQHGLAYAGGIVRLGEAA